MLASIEKGHQLCHFDLHFENILYDKENHFIIDRTNAKEAKPVLDVARSYVILRQYAYRMSQTYLRKVKGLYNPLELEKAIYVMAFDRFVETGYDQSIESITQLI